MVDFSNRLKSGVQQRPLRTIIYGWEGVGKSSFAAEFPDSIFLSPEDGVSHIDTQSLVPANWSDLIQMLIWLSEEKKGAYKTLNIDTLGEVAELCAKYVCERNNVKSLEDIGYGKWKRMLFDEFQIFISWCTLLYNQGMNINFIAHATVSTFKNPSGDDYDRYNVQINRDELAEEVRHWVDIICFMNFDTTVVEADNKMKASKAQSTGAHQLHLVRAAAFEAKNRWQMPAMLDMGKSPEAAFKKFWSEYEKGLARAAKGRKASKAAPKGPVAVDAAPAKDLLTPPPPPPQPASPAATATA